MLQLLDLAGIYFRAFYAMPSTMRSPDGHPMGAIRGTLDIMRKVIGDASPTRVICCLDLDWRPAWRVRLVPSYKAHRVAGINTAGTNPAGTNPAGTNPAGTNPGGASTSGVNSPRVGAAAPGTESAEPAWAEEVPDDLAVQVPVLLDLLAALGFTTAGAAGCEADDVIGTLAGAEQRDPVEVVTGDRDLFQVASDGPPRVAVRYIGAGMSKAQVYTAADVAARHGIPQGSYADFATLRGDPSDGLPGVAGIGDKTAAGLITRFGSIENLVAALDSADTGIPAGQFAKLAAAREYLDVAPEVVRVSRRAPIRLSPEGDGTLPRQPADPEAVAALSDRYGIGGAVDRLVAALPRPGPAAGAAR